MRRKNRKLKYKWPTDSRTHLTPRETEVIAKAAGRVFLSIVRRVKDPTKRSLLLYRAKEELAYQMIVRWSARAE